MTVCELTLEDNAILAALGDGGLRPSDEDIAWAPVIEDWSILNEARPCLLGVVTNHPAVDDGPIVTTFVIAADISRGWVRTENTLYRLGDHL